MELQDLEGMSQRARGVTGLDFEDAGWWEAEYKVEEGKAN